MQYVSTLWQKVNHISLTSIPIVFTSQALLRTGKRLAIHSENISESKNNMPAIALDIQDAKMNKRIQRARAQVITAWYMWEKRAQVLEQQRMATLFHLVEEDQWV